MGRRFRLVTWLRYARFLAREFRWSGSVFLAIVLGGGLLVHLTYTLESLDYVKACYGVFLLIFMQPELRFPNEAVLRVLWFVIPVVGLGAVADSVVRLGYFIFSRKQHLQEWQIMEASAMRDHYIVIGVGKVGYRILLELNVLRLEAVAVERKPESHLLSEIMDLGIPVIRGDARLKKSLENANVAKARAIILATDDDLANIDAALTAREIRPDIRVVLRLFDDTLADRVANVFKMPAISTSQTAVPAFIAAATGRSVYQSIRIENQDLHLADIDVVPASPLVGRPVSDLLSQHDLSVVLLRRGGKSDVNPEAHTVLQTGDKIVVLGPVARIADFAALGRTA
ncbi:MAG TPA: NAD-binding protein [Planctomycetota bacterium]|nr:NAD-binding protein [Planctomycetota bacterium]